MLLKILVQRITVPTNERGKEFSLVTHLSKYLLKGYYMPGTVSGTIFIFWAAQP